MGTIDNKLGGVIENDEGGEIKNEGVINKNNLNENFEDFFEDFTMITNEGIITNKGTINNNNENYIVNISGTITNSEGGTINNEGGRIYSFSAGTIIGTESDTIIGNPIMQEMSVERHQTAHLRSVTLN